MISALVVALILAKACAFLTSRKRKAVKTRILYANWGME